MNIESTDQTLILILIVIFAGYGYQELRKWKNKRKK